MTYSIAGRCARTGMLGVAITTSSIAVGSRCAHVRAKVGAVLTQHRTDPRLGPRGLDFLERGLGAEDTVAALVKSTPDHGWRQLVVVDAAGRSAIYSGARIYSIHAEARGRDCAAAGNIIANTAVPAAMVRAFEADPAAALPARLVAALKAGHDAGGEIKQVVSAGLLVAHEQSFPYVDLRVDDHADPIGELARLWAAYEPVADDYVMRATAPDGAESFGELSRPPA